MKDFWSWYNKKYGLKEFKESEKEIDIERAKHDINYFADKILGVKTPFISQQMLDLIEKTEKQKEDTDKMIDDMNDHIVMPNLLLPPGIFDHPINFGHFNCAGDWISPDGTNCGKPFDDKNNDKGEEDEEN